MNRHSVQPTLPAICVAVALVVATSVACAQADAPQSEKVEESAAEMPAADSPSMEQSIARDQLSPVVAAIFAALDAERARIRLLNDELTSTNDPARAFELQRALVAAKQDAELRMLNIQAEHARRENRTEVVAELEGAIRALTTPATGREPEPRAASAVGR